MNHAMKGWQMGLTACFVTAALAAIGFAAVPADPVSFKTLAAGDHSRIETRRDVVVRTTAEWKALWKQHAPDRPQPAVDLARSTVLGLFLGSRPTAGFTLTITAVERKGAELVVTYRERPPAPTDMVAQMLTAPFVLLTVDRFTGRVRFVRTP
jgi:PrcB C-terminal